MAAAATCDETVPCEPGAFLFRFCNKAYKKLDIAC